MIKDFSLILNSLKLKAQDVVIYTSPMKEM